MQEQNNEIQRDPEDIKRRMRAMRALNELQLMFKDDPELQSMTEEDIVREVKAIRRELYYANSARH